MEQIVNPYLPLIEYVPDGEPHVFGNRVYIYGSHDKAEGTVYCEQDYVTWSASIDNLKDWRYEGVIYRKNQDPTNKEGKMQLWAPDVTKGPDGKYYLYYCFNFYPEIGVAVSDSPVGPFAYYGHVKYPKELNGGKILREYMPFDPAVFTDEDDRVYLYYGFAPAGEKEMIFPEFSPEEFEALPIETKNQLEKAKNIKFGEYGMVVELEQDMITTKGEPQNLIPSGNHTAGTGFENHGFFEAPSMRKIKEKYYIVYSSQRSHELCYAISEEPTKGFKYGGTIVSSGDIGIEGNKETVNVLGNNHGSIEKIGDNYYIFYHRQTNGTEFSRQGCAEQIEIEQDGSIKQVEITSCGLNGVPLKASGIYPAAIACHITSPLTLNTIEYTNPYMKEQTHIIQQQNVTVITNIMDKSIVGYKYFNVKEVKSVLVELKGDFMGQIILSMDKKGQHILGKAAVNTQKEAWEITIIPIEIKSEKIALYFHFAGSGKCKMKSMGFQ